MDDFTHRYTRRKKGRDYRAPGIYHIILKKAPSAPVFGLLTGDARVSPGNPGCADIELTELGKVIARILYNLRFVEPKIQIYQYKIMPDHVHILLRVRENLEKALGCYIGGMKTGIRNLWEERIMGKDGRCAVTEMTDHGSCAAVAAGHESSGGVPPVEIFEKGYTDRIIYKDRKLDTVFRYIKENPHRLAMRKLHPDFFKRARRVEIDGKTYEAYGNLFHLRNPFKKQIVVHRANTQEENDALFEECREEIKAGVVLVSPFISPLEKKIRKDALERGGRIIHIQKDAFGERYKPAESDFNLCGEGRLLIIAPLKSLGRDLTRDICMEMNRIAGAIVDAVEIKAR